MKNVVIIGYSGHGFVVVDTFLKSGRTVVGYCEREAKTVNPFDLDYFGTEVSETGLAALGANDWFIAIGENAIRRRIFEKLTHDFELPLPTNCVHPTAILSNKIKVGLGVLIAPRSVVNSLSSIGNGVILNSGSIIEHECVISDFVHVAPGAIICGNVSIGENSFIGANSTIKQGLIIGKNVIIGAGSVILEDVKDNSKIVGNPARLIL